jgi:flotillin
MESMNPTLSFLQEGFFGGANDASNLPFTLTVLAVAVVVSSLFIAFARRYKRCPSNRILVIDGRSKQGRVARTLHGGGALVLPVLEDY